MSVSKRKSKLKKQNEMISTLMQLSNQLKNEFWKKFGKQKVRTDALPDVRQDVSLSFL